MTAREVWRHELRWARTIRAIEPLGYAGSAVAYPLAWAVIAALLGAISGTSWPGFTLAIAAATGRIALLYHTGRRFGFTPQSYWLVPARELFSFAIFMASFLGRDVNWRGGRFRIGAAGRLLSDRDQRDT